MKEDFPVTTTTETQIVAVPLDELQPADDNLRGPVGDVSELARSIAGVGVIEPLVVVPLDGEPRRYRIVAGHRRHLAAAKAGLDAVPCLIREMTEAERVEVMLVENLQRSEIPVLAEGTGYFRLVSEHGYTIRRIARQVGRSDRHVRARLALLELPDAAQDAVQKNELTIGQAEALLAAKDKPEVIKAILAEPDWRRRDMDQVVADALRRAEHEERREALVAELAEASVRVVPSEGYRPKSYLRLSDLGIDEAAHRDETCHAVVVETGYAGPVTVAVCTDRRRHSRRAPAGDRSDLQVDAEPDPERERAKERRRLAQRRQEFVRSRLTTRLPKAAAVDLLVAALLDRANTNDAGRAGSLLELTARPGRYGDDWHGPLGELAARSEADRLRVGVALASAMAEGRIAGGGYRNGTERYLDFLCSLGYEREPDEAPSTADQSVEAVPAES
jgi:ParB family transcriptional regulator, chromosome partitioning protein